MIKFNFLLQIFATVIIMIGSACNQKTPNIKEQTVKPNFNREYSKDKAMFPRKFVSQFPDSAISEVNRLSLSYSPDSNEIYFFLYEYDKPIGEIDSVKNLLSSNSIATYSSMDTCLLIINEGEREKLFSRFLFKENCLTAKYPVPFFNRHKDESNKNLLTKLDESFSINILDADTVDAFDFDVPKNTGSNKWRNGYSKGISISKEKRAIIYWSIAW